MAEIAVPEPAQIEATFRVADGLYLVGSLERGVTLYNQQVRAHNLVWALWEMEKVGDRKVGKVAVIGAGAAGLTVTAGLLARYQGKVPVTLFEQLWDLCPLQQGSDARWLHPRIYGWPDIGSRAPGASLPVLNWSEGRASDVARTLVRGFGDFCDEFAKSDGALSIVIGLRDFELRARSLEISWVGTRAERSDAFVRRGDAVRGAAHFDTIVVASGFGLESVPDGNHTVSYWRNEQIAQPFLDGNQQRYLVSGFGDGALVDLCRLAIERFRQDTILYEVFGASLEQVEARFRADRSRMQPAANLFEYFQCIDDSVLARARENLAARIRKDTAAVLHIAGRNNETKSLAEIFGPSSSFLNRLMTYLLHRCGAFTTSSSSLEGAVQEFSVNSENVICRHGTDAKARLQSMILDYDELDARLTEMQNSQVQSPVRLWKPGAFPVPQRGMQR